MGVVICRGWWSIWWWSMVDLEVESNSTGQILTTKFFFGVGRKIWNQAYDRTKPTYNLLSYSLRNYWGLYAYILILTISLILTFVAQLSSVLIKLHTSRPQHMKIPSSNSRLNLNNKLLKLSRNIILVAELANLKTRNSSHIKILEKKLNFEKKIIKQ